MADSPRVIVLDAKLTSCHREASNSGVELHGRCDVLGGGGRCDVPVEDADVGVP